MKIKLNKNFNGLTNFESPELPDFVVLCGKNGSGKTQLFKLLSMLNGNEQDKKNASEIVEIENFLPSHIINVPFGASTSSSNQITHAFGGMGKEHIEALRKRLKDALKNKNHKDPLLIKISEEICEIKKINKSEITAEDVDNYQFSDEDLLSVTPCLFIVKIGEIVSNYFYNYAQNILLNHINEGINPDEIPNPFEIINELFEKIGFEYRLKEELFKNYHKKQTYDPVFINVRTKHETKFDMLSSGEKVILALACALLNASPDRSHEKHSHTLLLLDELDAALHPSLIQQLLNVIKKYLVDEKKMKAILTTHHPTTVALSPENSIFSLKKNNGKTYLEKIDKRKAIKELLEGVHTLDVIPENKKQIFVEANEDESFFNEAYKILRDRLNPEVHLNFISSGVVNGDKNLVEATVAKLRLNGNGKVFGIVDWDGENSSKDGIFVHNELIRDALESLIFDPVFLGLFLIHSKILTPENIYGVSGHYRDHFIIKDHLELSGRTQKIINFMQDDILGVDPNAVVIKQKMINGIEPYYRKDYLHRDGHELEEMIATKYPAIKRYPKSLKASVIEHIIYHFPDFLPEDVLFLFKKIESS